MGFVVLRAVFLLKPLLPGQLVLLPKGSFLAQAIGAWTVGVVVLRAVFLLKPLLPGQWVLLF